MTHYERVHIQIGCAVEHIYTCRPSLMTCARTLTFCFAIFLDKVSCNPTCLDDCTCFHATVCAPSLALVLEWWRDFLKPQAWLNSFIFTWTVGFPFLCIKSTCTHSGSPMWALTCVFIVSATFFFCVCASSSNASKDKSAFPKWYVYILKEPSSSNSSITDYSRRIETEYFGGLLWHFFKHDKRMTSTAFDSGKLYPCCTSLIMKERSHETWFLLSVLTAK